MTPARTQAFLVDLIERPPAVLTRHGAAIPELARLRGCPQPVNQHAEGDVWAHTELALTMLANLRPTITEHAGAELGRAGLAIPDFGPTSLERALAVLLHDVAKPLTIAGPPGRWTYYGHDHLGADTAETLCDRLDLPAAARALGWTLDMERVRWLIDQHLFWLNTRVDRVTDRALARRWGHEDGRGEDLQALAWSDTLGSRGPDGRPHVELLVRAEVRLARFRQDQAAPDRDSRPPLDGHEVMRLLSLEPGPRVGAVLAWLRRQTTERMHATLLLQRHGDWLRSAPLSELRPGGNTATGA